MGVLGGEISSGIDLTLSGAQHSVVIGTSQNAWDIQERNGREKWKNTRNLTKDIANNKNYLNSKQLQNRIDGETAVLDRDNTLARGNADRNRTTQKANATRTQTTSKTNATNTQSTTKTNADNNYNTDRTNATNTRNVTVANADYTRQVSELNAKELLENAANAGMAGILDARNASPVQIGQASGNPSVDYMENRGVQLKVKTQSDSAIRQTGDMFARYGYALNQVWNVAESGLCLMRNFTYWKASDIWVDDRNSSNNSIQDFFINIFMNGVTVWSNPLKMGRVSIYDN
jgi:surface antigen